MKTMKIKLTVLFLTLFTLAFVFFSCETPLALGKMLNIDPPIVTIVSPQLMENVGRNILGITGTATDLEEVVSLSITVERTNELGARWKEEWYGERGLWRSIVEGSSWESQSGDGIKWDTSAGEGNVIWAIAISMTEAPDGEYLISAGAVNNVGTAGPLVQRRVIIDNSAPSVQINYPVLLSAGWYDSETEKPADRKKTENREFIHNQSLSIQYEVDDDFSVQSLAFILTDEDGRVFYDSGVRTDLGWSGNFIIEAKDIIDPDTDLPFGMNAQGEITGEDVVNLYLRTEAEDKAGNWDADYHGWLTWWPASDRPWADGIGDPVAASNALVYPGSNVQIQAYDDDGVKSVSYKIFVEGDPTTPYQEDSKGNTPLDGGGYSTFFNWGFQAPDKANEYRIEITVEDDHGIINDPIDIRYFEVYSVLTPGIVFDDVTKNWETTTLFGNSTGGFSLSGFVTDGSAPTRLTVAWIKPVNTTITNPALAKTEQQRFITNLNEYSSADYNGWPSAVIASGPAIDSDGNKLWDITLPAANAPDDEHGDDRWWSTFNINLNLFSDLGISSNIPLSEQYFVFRLVGGNPTNRTKADLLVLRGDLDPPNVEIGTISLKSQTASRAQIRAGYTFQGPFDPSDTVTVTGTWDDDSFDTARSNTWPDSAIASRMFINATWNSQPMTVNLAVTGRTWTATMDLGDNASAGGGEFIVTLKDLAGNIGQDYGNPKMESDVPVLTKVAADQPAGSYRAGSVDIYLEFNKPVRLNNTTTAPTLTIANGSGVTIASYNTVKNAVGSTATKHYFSFNIDNVASGNQTTDALNVSGITLNGLQFVGASGNPAIVQNSTFTSLTSSNNNLNRQTPITIDKKPPVITGITSLSGIPVPGETHFKADQSIYILVEFDEPITFSNTAGAATTLTLNATNGAGGTGGTQAVTVGNPSPSGTNALRFVYTVATGYNTPYTENAATEFTTPQTTGLSVTAINIGGGRIRDSALHANDLNDFTNSLNTLTSTVIPASVNIDIGTDAQKIIVDTRRPGKPSITGITNGTSESDQTFTVSSENGASVEYTTDGGTNWQPYQDAAVTIVAPRTYNILARQTDRAQNLSPVSDEVIFTITPSTPLLQGLTVPPPKTFKEGENIDIILNLKENVTVSGGNPYIVLSGSSPAAWTGNAVYLSGSGTNKLTFRYPVVLGDNVDLLGFATNNSFNFSGATFTTSSGNANTLFQRNWDNTSIRHDLSFYTTIAIKTDKPRFTGAEINADGSKLILNFTKNIYKGTGNITIEQDTALDAYLAPAVMSKDDFQLWGGTSKLGNYYKLGTNGANPSGVADNTEKYILDYATSPADTNLVGALTPSTGTAAHRVTANVIDNKGVVVNGSSLEVDLSIYKLRVKGVRYKVSFPTTLIQDDLNNSIETSLALQTQYNYSVTGTNITFPNTAPEPHPLLNPGVSEPFIRVNRISETYGTGANLAATQSFTTTFRIDTQTTGATIYYRTGTTTTPPQIGNDANRFNGTANPPVPIPAMPAQATGGTTSGTINDLSTTVLIGAAKALANNSSNDGNFGQSYQGQVIGITAEARRIFYPDKTYEVTYNSNSDGLKHEIAARSVVALLNPTNVGNNTWNTANNNKPTNNPLRVWLRGGDSTSGANLTSGFPLAWDEKDHQKVPATLARTGARLLTTDGNDDGLHYWVTWEVTKTAYFHFLVGTVDADSATNGPKDWVWAKNAWSFQYDKYPLHPGGSLLFKNDTRTTSDATGDLEWHTVFSSR